MNKLEPKGEVVKQLKIKGFRGIGTEVAIPIAPGVVLLKGLNGIGKTTAIEAVEAAISKQTPPPVGDGQVSAYVDAKDAFGVTLTVGKTSRRAGELTIKTIHGKLDISDIVDPKLKTPEAADAARIKALIGLSGLQPSPELFEPLLGPELFAKVTSAGTRETKDVVLLAERVKRDCETHARLEEDTYKTIIGKAEACEQACEGIDTTAPSDRSQLHEALEAAIRAESTLQQQAAESKRQAEAHAEACDELALLLKTTGDLDAAAAQDRAADSTAKRATASAAVARLEQELATAKIELREAVTQLAHDEQMLAKIKQAESTIAAVRAKAEKKPGAGPSADAIAEAEQATATARQAVENGALVRAAIKQKSDALGYRMLAEKHEKQAEKLRTAARSVDNILSEQIAKFFSQVWVEAGRLKTTTKRGTEFVHDLSPGMIGRIAVEIGVKAVGANGLLTLSQVVWEGLDPVNQRAIDELAKESDVTILTGRCTEDEELTAEVFSA